MQIWNSPASLVIILVPTFDDYCGLLIDQLIGRLVNGLTNSWKTESYSVGKQDELKLDLYRLYVATIHTISTASLSI